MKLLLLPGMDGTGRMFDPILPLLSLFLEPEVISYPPRSLRTYDELLAQISAPPSDFVILAESFSGPLGIQLAARNPDRVRALILVATFASSPVKAGKLFRPLVAPWQFRYVVMKRLACRALVGTFRGELADTLRGVLQDVSPDVLAFRLREILGVDVTHSLLKIKAPVLYLQGKKDFVVGRRNVDTIRALIPHLQVAELDTGHLLLQQQPAGAAGLIRQFLQKG